MRWSTTAAAIVVTCVAACGGSDYAALGVLADRRPPPVVRAPVSPSYEIERPPTFTRAHRPLPKPTEARLSSGIRVLVLEQHEFPAATVGFVLDRGAAAAPPGVAALYAHAIRHGSTKTESSKEMVRELAWLGARTSAHSSLDAVSLSVTALSPILPSVLPRACAMATTPTFDDESMSEARSNARSAVIAARENPRALGDATLRRLLYPEKHPYGVAPAAIEPERFTRMSRYELESFRDMYVAHDRLTVVAVGDVTLDALRPGLERCLRGVSRKRAAEAPPVPAPSPPTRSRIVLVPRAGASQANIAIGSLGVRRDGAGHAAVAVLESLLGRALSGRLDLKIRGEHGYSYGVRMSAASFREGGMVQVTTAADTAHAAETLRGLWTELVRAHKEPIDQSELVRAKHHALSTLLDEEDAISGGFAVLWSLAVSGLPLRHYDQLAREIEELTESDVREAARKHFAGALQVAVVGDPSLLEPLQALGIADVTLHRD